jgi:ABC-type antimicrobial peptide transport system permease subunit
MAKQFIKMLFFALLGVITLIPAILTSVYFFKGCSKTDWLAIMGKLSTTSIFIFVLLAFITSFIIALYCFHKVINIDIKARNSDIRNAIMIAVREAQTNNLKIVKDSDNDEDKA